MQKYRNTEKRWPKRLDCEIGAVKTWERYERKRLNYNINEEKLHQKSLIQTITGSKILCQNSILCVLGENVDEYLYNLGVARPFPCCF